ncbi:MAG: tetratricopeptide repeat protein [Isosphaeraceae bacterium]
MSERVGSQADSETALRKAETILEGLDDGRDDRTRLARVRRLLGVRATQLNRYDEAEQHLAKSLAEFRAQARDAPDSPEALGDLGATLVQLGTLESARGRVDEARTTFAEARDLLRARADRDRPEPAVQLALFRALNNLGVALNQANRPDDAEQALREAVDVAGRLAEGSPKSLDARDNLALAVTNLGFGLGRRNRFDEAEPVLRRAESLYRDLLREAPSVSAWWRSLGTAYNTLGTVYQAQGRPDQAGAAYGQALEIYDRLDRDHPEQPAYAVRAAGLRLNIGMLASEAGKPDEALGLGMEARKALQRVLEKQPRDDLARRIHLATSRHIAQVQARLGRYGEALAGWDEALALAPTPEDKSLLAAERLIAVAHLKPFDEASAEADALEAGLGPRDGEARFNLAIVHAQLADAAARDDALDPDERERRIAAGAQAARKLLDRARGEGLFRNPNRLRTLRSGPFFAPLRDRPEIRPFLLEPAAP